MKAAFILVWSLVTNVAFAQSFPRIDATCTNGLSRPRTPVKLTPGVYQGMRAQILKIDSKRSLVFTVSPLPDYGQQMGFVSTFRLVVDGKTVISTSETYGLAELRSGRNLSLNFLVTDEALGLTLQCQAMASR